MDAAKSVVLVSRYKMVSPRSPISSDKWNDNVNEVGADLRSLTTQVNRILWAINTGADKEVIWKNSTVTEGEHGIDANALWWDSTADSKESIYAHVNTLSADILNITGTVIPSLSAGNIGYTNTDVSWFATSVNQNVKHALDKIIQELPTITGPDGLPGVLLSNVTVDGSFYQPGASSGFTVGTQEIPWAGGYFNNLDITGQLTLGGTVITSAGMATTASAVSYAPAASTPNYTDQTITNVEEALNVVGAFDMDQLFPNADQPIKQIPTVGMTGTTGMTVKEWLNEMFFPFIQAGVSFNSISYQELGTTANLTLDGVVTLADETAFTSLILTDGASGSYPLSANSGNWSQAVSATANTTYTITLNAGSPDYVKTAERSVAFYAPTFYTSGGAGAGLTIADLQALTLGTEKFIKPTTSGSHTFTVANGYFYIAYPSVYGQLTSIKDPNNFENIDAVGFVSSDGSLTTTSTATTIPFTLLDNSVVNYYVYRWIDLTSQTNYTLTFS
jgi:hypothetical protein